MKKLSLLVLAGLTTGCFAAEQEQPAASCWDLIDMMRDTNRYATPQEALEATASIPGLNDCAENYDKFARIAQNPQLNRKDHKSIKLIQRHLAAQRGQDSLDAVILNDATKQASAALDQRISIVSEFIKANHENTNAITESLKANSELLQSEIARSNTIATYSMITALSLAAIAIFGPNMFASKKS